MNFNIKRADTNVPYMHKLTIQFYLEEVTYIVGIKEEQGEGAAMVGTAIQTRKN